MNIELSTRQEQVLGYIAKGKSNKEIARELGLSADTVTFYIKGLFRKTNCKNRADLAACFSSGQFPKIDIEDFESY